MHLKERYCTGYIPNLQRRHQSPTGANFRLSKHATQLFSNEVRFTSGAAPRKTIPRSPSVRLRLRRLAAELRRPSLCYAGGYLECCAPNCSAEAGKRGAAAFSRRPGVMAQIRCLQTEQGGLFWPRQERARAVRLTTHHHRRRPARTTAPNFARNCLRSLDEAADACPPACPSAEAPTCLDYNAPSGQGPRRKSTQK